MTARLLVLSIIAATIVLPMLAARDPSAMGGLKKALLFALTFNVFYALAVRFVYPHLVN